MLEKKCFGLKEFNLHLRNDVRTAGRYIKIHRSTR